MTASFASHFHREDRWQAAKFGEDVPWTYAFKVCNQELSQKLTNIFYLWENNARQHSPNEGSRKQEAVLWSLPPGMTSFLFVAPDQNVSSDRPFERG